MGKNCFACTRCGECCKGWLPLTLADAVRHADKFPLAMAWTTEEPQAYTPLSVILSPVDWGGKGKPVALTIMPVCYIPPTWPCPSLNAEKLCAIQDDKPLRCRTMPFYPWRNEDAQATMLIPRKEWKCDVSSTAPAVYEEQQILFPEEFNIERDALLKDKPLIQAYAQKMIKQQGSIIAFVEQVRQKKASSRIICSFASFLRQSPAFDLASISKKQHPVLLSFTEQTGHDASLAAYHSYYKNAAQELAWHARQP